MLLGSHLTRMETFNVNKNVLLTVDNPHLRKRQSKVSPPGAGKVKCRWQEKTTAHSCYSKRGDYARIKTDRPPLIGQCGEPVAEYSRLGWFIMSPGNEFNRQTKPCFFHRLVTYIISSGLFGAPRFDRAWTSTSGSCRVQGTITAVGWRMVWNRVTLLKQSSAPPL